LLDEEDLGEDDEVVIKGREFDSNVKYVRVRERSWDACELIIYLDNHKIIKMAILQTAQHDFELCEENIKQLEGISSYKMQTTFCNDKIIVANPGIFEGDFYFNDIAN